MTTTWERFSPLFYYEVEVQNAEATCSRPHCPINGNTHIQIHLPDSIQYKAQTLY